MESLRQYLEPIADFFRSWGIPETIVHWGHPLMMAIVVFVMGSFVAFAGWRGRVLADNEVATESKLAHRKLAPWMFMFIALGYTGGVLSLVMQGEAIFSSSHFWTGSLVLILLTANGVIAVTNFGKNKPVLRTIHAYVGSAAVCILFFHALLGLRLGLNI